MFSTPLGMLAVTPLPLTATSQPVAAAPNSERGRACVSPALREMADGRPVMATPSAAQAVGSREQTRARASRDERRRERVFFFMARTPSKLLFHRSVRLYHTSNLDGEM